MSITIWHNPHCSKSRQTLALLMGNGHVPNVVKYLDTGPRIDQIRAVLVALDVPAIDLMRIGEKLFKELGLSKTDSDEILINAMAANPILIERPVVLCGSRAAIGRPPESVLDIL
jgi:arsenate reductase